MKTEQKVQFPDVSKIRSRKGEVASEGLRSIPTSSPIEGGCGLGLRGDGRGSETSPGPGMRICSEIEGAGARSAAVGCSS